MAQPSGCRAGCCSDTNAVILSEPPGMLSSPVREPVGSSQLQKDAGNVILETDQPSGKASLQAGSGNAGCQDSCCEVAVVSPSPPAPACNDGCCKISDFNNATKTCQDGCCDTAEDVKSPENCEDQCCGRPVHDAPSKEAVSTLLGCGKETTCCIDTGEDPRDSCSNEDDKSLTGCDKCDELVKSGESPCCTGKKRSCVDLFWALLRFHR
jgi:hypothetical protein